MLFTRYVEDSTYAARLSAVISRNYDMSVDAEQAEICLTYAGFNHTTRITSLKTYVVIRRGSLSIGGTGRVVVVMLPHFVKWHFVEYYAILPHHQMQ